MLITALFLTLTHPGRAEGIPFIPPVYNYTTVNYKAGNQNWSITQGSDGVIYDASAYELRALNRGVDYFFAIEAFNENGISDLVSF